MDEAAHEAQRYLMGKTLRIYVNRDLVGVESGGALKNIIAIAAGICDGLEPGDNTKATVITRGLAEIVRLGVKLGGKPSTFAGLSGMGDLIATACSTHSRNWRAGYQNRAGKRSSCGSSGAAGGGGSTYRPLCFGSGREAWCAYAYHRGGL